MSDDFNVMNLRNLFISIMVLLTLLASKIEAQQKYDDISAGQRVLIFKEAFDNNNNDWITDNTWISGKFVSGSYDVACKNFKQNTGLAYANKTVPIDYTKDFEVETSFKIIKGAGALVFGLTKDFSHYRIEIDEKKNLTIVKDVPAKNNTEILFSAKEGALINNTGVNNKLTVRKFYDQYYVYVNDLLVKQFSNLVLNDGSVGFSVGLNSEISVDYINVSYLSKPVVPLTAEKLPAQKDTATIKTPYREISIPDENLKPVNTPEGPIITWTSPTAAKTTWEAYSASLKAIVKSNSELSSVIFYVNGTPQGEAERRLIQGEPGKYSIEKVVNLDPGENVIYFTVTDEKLQSNRSENRYFVNPEASKPLISWSVPAMSNVIVNDERLNIEACVKSPSGLRSIKVLVNGEPMGGDNVFKIYNDNDCNIKWQYPIILKEGTDNSIVIIAENFAGSTTSDNRVVRYLKKSVEKRIALVLGNSNYVNKTPLKNPIQDANLLEATLKDLDFTVLKYVNLGLDSMRKAIRDFSQKMKLYNVALFYYAGHGVQVDGRNYLVPVDAKLQSKDDCAFEAFAVDDLLAQFAKNPQNINIAILDACRSNPFASWARGNEAGFVTLNNTSGVFVSFATAPGATAADGSTGNGLFTEELVKQMNIPQPISSVFMNTRINVWAKSKQTQRPQEWNDLNGDFYFKK
jgi:hypothetical protein